MSASSHDFMTARQLAEELLKTPDAVVVVALGDGVGSTVSGVSAPRKFVAHLRDARISLGRIREIDERGRGADLDAVVLRPVLI